MVSFENPVELGPTYCLINCTHEREGPVRSRQPRLILFSLGCRCNRWQISDDRVSWPFFLDRSQKIRSNCDTSL